VAIKLKTTGEYKRAIAALRYYADGFTAADGYDLRHLSNEYHNPLTRSQRAKIARYYDVLQRHAGYKGTTFQQFRDPKKLAGAQKAMGMPTGQSWRGVFVPQPSENTPAKLVMHRKMWVIEYWENGVDSIFVPFDKLEFAERDIEYVRELFEGAPSEYLYNLDMGHGRNRWKAGGNLDQMLSDLGRLVQNNLSGVSGQSAFEEYIMGVHVYRGGLKNFNKLKTEHFKTLNMKRVTQEQIKTIIRKERRRLHDYQEYLRLMRKFGNK